MQLGLWYDGVIYEQLGTYEEILQPLVKEAKHKGTGCWLIFSSGLKILEIRKNG